MKVERCELGWLYVLVLIFGIVVGMCVTSVYFHVNIQEMEKAHQLELIDILKDNKDCQCGIKA